MAAWLMLSLCGLLAAPPEPVIVQACPSGGVAAVSLVIGLDPTDVPLSKRGLDAVFAETLLMQMNEELTRPTSGAARFRHRLPPTRGIDVIRRPQYLAVTVNCTADAAEDALAFLVTSVLDAVPSDEVVERSKKAVLVRRDEWVRNISEPTEELFERALYIGLAPDFFYGTPETLKKIRAEDVAALRHKLIVRANVRLAAVVPGGAASLREKMRAALRSLPEGRGYKRPYFAREPRVAVRDNPAINRASIIVGGPLPQPGDRGYWAGWLVREMLAGPDGAIIKSRELTSRLGLLIPRGMDWHAWPIQPLDIPIAPAPYLAIHALCHPARIELVRRGLVSQLRRIADNAFGDDELQRARIRAANIYARRTAPARDRARLLALMSLIGVELPDVNAVCETLQSLTRNEVAAAARDILANLAVGLQMPRP